MMKTLDDLWNTKELTTFCKRHSKDCVVRWPSQTPTHGIEDHEQKALAFFKTFPNQHLVNIPCKVIIAQDDWTSTIADFNGTIDDGRRHSNCTYEQEHLKWISALLRIGMKMEKS